MYPSSLTHKELFKEEEWMPNLANDIAEAQLLMSYIKTIMTPAAEEIDPLTFVKLLSEAKARYFLKIARGELKSILDPAMCAQRAMAYLRRSGKRPEDIGTTEGELSALSRPRPQLKLDNQGRL
jgi:hypothetical protein